MATTITDLALLRLCHLSSVALPIGGYAFSQGLEAAIEEEWITDAGNATTWLDQQLQHSLVYTDIALFLRLYRACAANDRAALLRCNDWLLACRESEELLRTDTAMGAALAKLLRQIGMSLPELPQEISYTAMFAYAAVQWRIPCREAGTGMLWAWLENQVAAATKLVPLGQSQAQQMLVTLQPRLLVAMDRAEQLGDDDIGAGLPMLGILSARHETQYSRLFRS